MRFDICPMTPTSNAGTWISWASQSALMVTTNACTDVVLKYSCPFLFTNHIYSPHPTQQKEICHKGDLTTDGKTDAWLDHVTGMFSGTRGGGSILGESSACYFVLSRIFHVISCHDGVMLLPSCLYTLPSCHWGSCDATYWQKIKEGGSVISVSLTCCIPAAILCSTHTGRH